MDFIHQYIDRLKPAAERAGEFARASVERIVARLDRIIEAVESEEFMELRRKVPLTLTAAGGANDRFDITVPVGEVWELTTVAIEGNTTVRLTENGRMVWFGGVSGFGFGLIVQGGDQLQVLNTGANEANVFLQFKIKKSHPRTRPVVSAGTSEVGPEHNGANVHPESERHTAPGTWAGQPVRGAHHG